MYICKEERKVVRSTLCIFSRQKMVFKVENDKRQETRDKATELKRYISRTLKKRTKINQKW